MSCPLVRQLPLSTDGMSDLELRFKTVSGYAGTRKVVCTATSNRTDGTILDSQEKEMNVPGGLFNSTVLMDFNNAITASVSKGTYTVYCQLPADVVLHSIYHSEVDGINGN